jgi:hypothetical protein
MNSKRQSIHSQRNNVSLVKLVGEIGDVFDTAALKSKGKVRKYFVFSFKSAPD